MLGAGMMGAGIAFVSAAARVRRRAKDVRDRGDGRKGQGLLRSSKPRRSARRDTADTSSEVLGAFRRPPTADFKGVDFVVEAVFES